MSMSELRQDYNEETTPLTEDDFTFKNPIRIFGEWFEIAKNTSGIFEPNAMTIATVTKEGLPTARIVLLKEFSSKGFTFFTHYGSPKAQDLESTPCAALVFYWPSLFWSVRIEGTVEKLPATENDKYFASRPRLHQISTSITEHQGALESRAVLDRRICECEKLYSGKEIPRPDFWGGYIVIPKTIEFWQGQSSRLSDRFLFKQKADIAKDSVDWKNGDDGWMYQRLEP